MTGLALTGLALLALAEPRRDVQLVRMDDGAHLETHVQRPRGEGPFPTVLLRSPYPIGSLLNARCRWLNARGYACVWQFVRGRGGSEGLWEPFEHEGADGAATFRWLAEQPWQDGRWALWGESYLGAVQWAVADQLPPQVKTLIPRFIGVDLYDGLYERRLIRHEIATAWMSLMPERDFRYLAGARGYHRGLESWPRTELDLTATRRELPWYRAWQEADHPDHPYWQRPIAVEAAQAPGALPVPVLMIAGWNDAFLGPQLSTWQRLAGREGAGADQLIVGPWDHLGRVSPRWDRQGLKTEGRAASQRDRVEGWLADHLQDGPPAPTGTLSWVSGGPGWQARPSWPPPSQPVTWWLGPGEDPQRCRGALESQPRAGQVTWTYDPTDPTPARGGPGLLAGALPGWRGITPGVVAQGRLCEQRDDLLGFRSEPLEAPLWLAGPLEAELTVSSSAPDTAFNVRFLEERPGGARYTLTEATATLVHPTGLGAPEPYPPGTSRVVRLKTWPLEFQLGAGSRLLVQIASASFPRLEAHPNLPPPYHLAEDPLPAEQTVLLAGSRVILPVFTTSPDEASAPR